MEDCRPQENDLSYFRVHSIIVAAYLLVGATFVWRLLHQGPQLAAGEEDIKSGRYALHVTLNSNLVAACQRSGFLVVDGFEMNLANTALISIHNSTADSLMATHKIRVEFGGIKPGNPLSRN